jgi:hypothetical protein
VEYFDVRNTVLIVVGHGILPEEEDRPIAYELKRAVNERAGGRENRMAVVLTDVWMMNTEMAELFPAISVGGPSVNAFTAQIYEALPVAVAKEQQWFVQMDEGHEKRAAIWGTETALTRDAVEEFVGGGYLDRFLKLVWRSE